MTHHAQTIEELRQMNKPPVERAIAELEFVIRKGEQDILRLCDNVFYTLRQRVIRMREELSIQEGTPNPKMKAPKKHNTSRKTPSVTK